MIDYQTELQKMVADDNLMNSYKLFMLKALLSNCSPEKSEFSFYELACWMIAYSFSTVCRLGKRIRHFDKLYDMAILLINEEDILMSSKVYDIYETALFSKSSLVRRSILSLTNYVPYRSLAYKWYEELKGKTDAEKNNLIVEFSNIDDDSFYRIIRVGKERSIVVNEKWADYIKLNRTTLLQWIDDKTNQFINKEY